MSGRIFQNVVLQFKETTDRTIGVIDGEGTVIACSELTGIGKKWSKYVSVINAAEGECVTLEGKTFKAHITEARLALAARRLRTSDESIASVAEACGYRNQTVFYQKFRERFGCTPREMRQGDAPSVSFE